jgi:hypothetical protein
MGKLIRNYNRQTRIDIPGQPTITGTETVAVLQNGQILSYKAFQPPQIATVPGQAVVPAEPFVMARVLVGNGLIIRVVVHGEENAMNVMEKNPVGSIMSAYLEQITGQGQRRVVTPGSLLPGGFGPNDGNGYRLIELIIPGAAIVGDPQVLSAATSRLEAAILAAGGNITGAPTAVTTRIDVRPAPSGAQAGGAVAGDAQVDHPEFSDRLTAALSKANQIETEQSEANA